MNVEIAGTIRCVVEDAEGNIVAAGPGDPTVVQLTETVPQKIEGDKVNLDIQQHDSSVSSVMGQASQHDLNLKIQETGNGYNLVGGSSFAPGVTITVEAKFIGDLLV